MVILNPQGNGQVEGKMRN